MRAAVTRAIAIERRSVPVRDSIEFTVPLPPPLNGLYANVPGKGRVKTRRYREWIKEAGWIIQGGRLGQIAGPVTVEIVLPRYARGDTDAYFKSLMDLAVRHGLIEDDKGKIVHGLSVSFWDQDKPKVTIRRAA